jgi:hypothetical protein
VETLKYNKLKYNKPIFVFLAIALCFGFAFIKDAKAADSNTELRGIMKGKTWTLKSAVLRKNLNNKKPKLTLELSDASALTSDICNPNLQTFAQPQNSVTIEIPIKTQGGFVNVMPDYENAMIHLSSEEQSLACYYSLKLNTQELNEDGLVYVSGDLRLSSSKTDTELVGYFQARVCD